MFFTSVVGEFWFKDSLVYDAGEEASFGDSEADADADELRVSCGKFSKEEGWGDRGDVRFDKAHERPGDLLSINVSRSVDGTRT